MKLSEIVFSEPKKYGDQFLVTVKNFSVELRGSRRTKLWTLYHKSPERVPTPDEKYADMDLENLKQRVRYLLTETPDPYQRLYDGIPYSERACHPLLLNLPLKDNWSITTPDESKTIYHTNNFLIMQDHPLKVSKVNFPILTVEKSKTIHKFWSEARKGPHNTIYPIGISRWRATAFIWFNDGLPPVDASLIDYIQSRYPQALWLPKLKYRRWTTNNYLTVFHQKTLVAVMIGTQTNETPSGIKDILKRK